MNEMKSKFAAFVGLDWADKKHDVCVQEGDVEQRKCHVIEHTPEAIEQWLVELHKRVKGNIAVVLELNKGPTNVFSNFLDGFAHNTNSFFMIRKLGFKT